MNKLVCLVVVLLNICLFSNCATKSKLAKAGIVLAQGAELNYKVNAGGEKYPFDVIINEISAKTISFDWNMGETRSGSIEMTEKVLTESKNLFNYFSRGHKKLENETSVWISSELFKALKAGSPVEIGLGKGVTETFKYKNSTSWSFGSKPDGSTYEIPVFRVTSNDGEKEIIIADDPQNRLIVMMNLDFRIDLVEFKPFK
jgi:hypothetical protein